MHRPLCSRASLAFSVTLLSGVLCTPVAAQTATIPVEEVTRGQKGWGLSVFAGEEPERFEVEVIGVMRNMAPDTSYILARLTGQGLEESGVPGGMSGSPVYLDDRLAGAVSFSWAFTNGAIAGITPIGAMQRLQGLEGGGAAGAGSPVVELTQLAAGAIPEGLLRDHLRGLVEHPLTGARTGVQWNSVGMGDVTRQFLAGVLPAFAPAGASGSSSSELVPGSSVAGVLVDGDFQLAVTGTVTDRQGGEILAFGHPFLGTGRLSIPMATSEVVTVLSSSLFSFKIANIGQVVGAFDLDRATGIRGQLGMEAPTIPMRVAVEAERTTTYDLRLADLPSVTPALVAISALAALDAGASAGGEAGVDLDLHLDLGDAGVVELDQSFDGGQAGLGAALYAFALTSYLLNNPLAEVHLKAVDVRLSHHPAPRSVRLLAAHAEAGVVEPGQLVRLNLEFARYRGEPYRRTVEVELPQSLTPGQYSLIVGDGASVTAARLAVEQRTPTDFRQALEFIADLRSRKDLVILGLVFDTGIAAGGTTRPRLPGSVQALWNASGTLGSAPLTLAIVQEIRERQELPLEGATRVDLTVRRSLGGLDQ